jgi:hypothetical protein
VGNSTPARRRSSRPCATGSASASPSSHRRGLTPLSALLADAGPGAAGTFVAISGVIEADQFGRASARFVRSLSAALGGQRPEPSAVYAAQAMEVVLDAIARSDGTRRSVLVGSVSFDHNGDAQDSPATILRVEPGARSVADAPDAAFTA